MSDAISVRSPPGWRLVDIDELPKAVQFDICSWIAENSPYFATSQDWTEVRDNLIGLTKAPKVWIGWADVEELHATMDRAVSVAAVTHYRSRLSDPGFEFDPILVADGGFLDGGHRMESYCLADRQTIPVVEVGHIVNASSETWERWMSGDLEAEFVPPGLPPTVPSVTDTPAP
jgi:hypothetical protein